MKLNNKYRIPRRTCGTNLVYPDHYAFVIVQDLGERDRIPCAMRQNGMIAVVVEEAYAEYQLKTTETSSLCENSSWEIVDATLQDLNSVVREGNWTERGMTGIEFFEGKEDKDFAQLGDIVAALGDYYDKEEVDLLLNDIDLSDYYTKTEVDNFLSNLPSDIQTLSSVLSEGNSADNKRITDLSDGVDAGDAVNKSQLDALESPFKIIDVTQQVYSNIAINVKDFNTIGVTYSEGAIDFGNNTNRTYTAGLYSFKLGSNTEASGDYSTAFGFNTEASGRNSSAFGGGTKASGDYSYAFGFNTEASGDYSIAFGGNAEASGVFSTAFNSETVASGNYSSAFGYSTEASGVMSTALGQNTKASGAFSVTFGNGTEANEYTSLAIGRFSEVGNVQNTWTNGSPIFKVGNGTSLSNRKNAYTLYNDGRSEQEKDMEVTTIGQGFVLKSPDGTRWRITVDNDGSLMTSELN